jgi:hypothetical protein
LQNLNQTVVTIVLHANRDKGIAAFAMKEGSEPFGFVVLVLHTRWDDHAINSGSSWYIPRGCDFLHKVLPCYTRPSGCIVSLLSPTWSPPEIF